MSVLRSMTGYGTASIENEAIQAQAAVRSVNHRFLDIAFHLGSGVVAFERGIRSMVESRLSRGRVDVTVRATLLEGAVTAVNVNHSLVDGWLNALREMHWHHKLQGTPTILDILRLPGVAEVGETTLKESQGQMLLDLLGQALDQLESMRREEGRRLTDHALRCLSAIEEGIQRIETMAEQERAPRLTALTEKIRGLILDLGLDEPRMYAEVARLVDRSEIAEEIERIRSHVALARGLVASEEASGKRLDFVAQELMREANTIGSKSASAALTHQVVGLKGDIERFREQVQNVE